MKKIQILIVEDELVIADDIKNSLENIGYRVSAVVDSGQEAINKVAELKPDLVLMDIMLRGGMDGIEASNHIRSLHGTPVIYLTSYADEEMLERAKVTEPFGYIIKPFVENELRTNIEMALYKHKIENELRNAKEKAEEATKLKDKFVSLVSHDLRSPIASVLGFAKLALKDEKHILHPDHKETFDCIIGCTSRTLTMIEELLQISRLQSGDIKLDPMFIDGHNSVAVASEEMSYLAKEKGIELKNEVPQGTRLYADLTLFGQVLINLVSNAVKFCRKGDVVTFFVPPGRKTTIAIKDTGMGMSESILKNLFKHEVKTTTVGAMGEKGTGLGMPLSHDIMKAHGGRLTAESTIGKGSVFYAELPPQKPHVLLVDDEEDFRFILKKLLRDNDLEILEAKNGEKALELLHAHDVHLIITDLIMPTMDGFELIKLIKQNKKTKSIPIIALTSDQDKETRERVMQMGGNDFVFKPLIAEDFIPRVERYLI